MTNSLLNYLCLSGGPSLSNVEMWEIETTPHPQPLSFSRCLWKYAAIDFLFHILKQLEWINHVGIDGVILQWCSEGKVRRRRLNARMHNVEMWSNWSASLSILSFTAIFPDYILLYKPLDQHAESLHAILQLSHKSHQDGRWRGLFPHFLFLCAQFLNVTPHCSHLFLIVIQVP